MGRSGAGGEGGVIGEKRVWRGEGGVATGESVDAVEGRVGQAGGQVAGCLTIRAEGEAQKRSDIRYLAPLPVFNPDGTVKE